MKSYCCEVMPSLEYIVKYPGLERIPELLKERAFTEKEIQDKLNSPCYQALGYSRMGYEHCRWASSVLLGIGNPVEKVTELYYPLDFISCLDDDSAILALAGELSDNCKVGFKCPYCGEFAFDFRVREAQRYYELENKYKCRQCIYKEELEAHKEELEERRKQKEEREKREEERYRRSQLKQQYPFRSLLESEIFNSIKTFYDGDYSLRNRSLLSSKLEIDIYYPKKQIGIEVNGDYWHRSKQSNTTCKEGMKEENYHTLKFLDGLKKKILIVNIFESEWKYNKQHIVNYLNDLFNDKSNDLSYINNEEIDLNFPPPLSSIRKLGISERSIVPSSFTSPICRNCIIFGVGHYKIAK